VSLFCVSSCWCFSQVTLESRSFSQVTLDFSHDKTAQDISIVGFSAILFSSYVGTHKSGTPQASLDLDANRLILLDRPGNGDDIPEDNDVPF
jgi:hypothetical protein